MSLQELFQGLNTTPQKRKYRSIKQDEKGKVSEHEFDTKEELKVWLEDTFFNHGMDYKHCTQNKQGNTVWSQFDIYVEANIKMINNKL